VQLESLAEMDKIIICALDMAVVDIVVVRSEAESISTTLQISMDISGKSSIT